ncbi:hypothetical protein ACFFMR_19015 [Micromonospora andamanensis]|uniref:DUF222 domain-containing protein n=1 Tax=Micromonospora andamanensis TaxID=1287068 RepID=A0ABQ4HYN7_9ACTN|nr:hypothetical protein [Micromonospora andamanensis]GIJ10759.1 hypothetical protein Van01_39730 [Micromonospora andamanensis]
MDSHRSPGAGTPAPGGLARLTHITDQLTAALHDLVQLVRDHRDAHDCPLTGIPCAGPWAAEQVLAMSPMQRAGLLTLAAVELEALGYGRPTAEDAVWPADPAGGGR